MKWIICIVAFLFATGGHAHIVLLKSGLPLPIQSSIFSNRSKCDTEDPAVTPRGGVTVICAYRPSVCPTGTTSSHGKFSPPSILCFVLGQNQRMGLEKERQSER